MPDCSEIQHIAGYDRSTGQWVEEYFYVRPDGQVFVLLRNDPPEGQKSQTPPSQVGLENGLCTVAEAPDAVEPVEVQEPTQTPQQAPRGRAPEIGGIGVLAIAAVAISIGGAIVLAKSREAQQQSRYDRHINQKKPFHPEPQPPSQSTSGDKEQALIGTQLYHQSPVQTALKNIWNIEKADPEYQEKKAFYLKIREQYESQYPNAKFEDNTT